MGVVLSMLRGVAYVPKLCLKRLAPMLLANSSFTFMYIDDLHVNIPVVMYTHVYMYNTCILIIMHVIYW